MVLLIRMSRLNRWSIEERQDIMYLMTTQGAGWTKSSDLRIHACHGLNPVTIDLYPQLRVLFLARAHQSSLLPAAIIFLAFFPAIQLGRSVTLLNALGMIPD